MCTRTVRRYLLLCSGVIIVFILGSTVPFLWDRLKLSSSEPAVIESQNQQYLPPYLYRNNLFIKQRQISEPKLENLNLSIGPLKGFLDNIFVSVKTTKKYHYPRLIILLETWVALIPDQTWFFTDWSSEDDKDVLLQNRTGNRLIYTNCSSSHQRLALSCKLEAEFEYFIRSHKSWWCHMDDDNYLNPVALANTLKRYDSSQPWYIGRTSTATPLTIFHEEERQATSFWFATGGAGFCLSRAMALKMSPFAGNGKFVEAGNRYWFPDDVTLGYIIESQLGFKLSVDFNFHSHLENLKSISQGELANCVTLSYSEERDETGEANVISIPGHFNKSVDPTRFYSLHCYLFGGVYCPS